MQLTSIKLLVADESLPFRDAVQKGLGRDKSIRVVGTAGSAGETVRKIHELEPDVLAADPDMLNLAEALAGIRERDVLPVITMGREKPASGLPGFCDFVRKPAGNSESDFSAFCNELCVKVKISYHPHPPVLAKTSCRERKARYHLIAIGASTGGTEATAEILRRLPGNLPGIVIVQHMPAGFTKMYAERLDGICKIGVFEAKDGDRVKQGTALIAPGGKQMSLKKDRDGYYVQCREGAKVNGHCPSVGFLFDSAAKSAGHDALGVILTGMGRDGAEGLLKMKSAGAYTIGQDKQSSVVYGMPMAAQEIGAVEEQAPIDKIADIIVRRILE